MEGSSTSALGFGSFSVIFAPGGRSEISSTVEVVGSACACCLSAIAGTKVGDEGFSSNFGTKGGVDGFNFDGFDGGVDGSLASDGTNGGLDGLSCFCACVSE